MEYHFNNYMKFETKTFNNSFFSLQGDESCWLAGKYVGKTTSGCFSTLLNKPLVFCYLPPVLTTKGVNFEVIENLKIT